MIEDGDDEEGDDVNLEVNCVDVAVDAQGVVTSLVVVTDGESFNSYVVVHPCIDRAGDVVHEIDSWCHSILRVESGPIYVVDNDGFLHTNETGHFRRTDLGAPMGLQRIREVAGQLVVCGANGTVLRRKGSRWQSIGKQLDFDLEGIDGFPDGTLYVAGDRGIAARIDDRGWQDLHIPTNVALLAVQVLPNGEVAMAGEIGQFYVGSGARWRAISPAPSAHGLCIYGTGVAVAGASAGVSVFDGSDFNSLRDDFDAQAVSASGRFLAVAAGSAVWRYDGKTWGHRTFSF